MHSNTINQFCSQLIPYQYVSFDIFDTLIFRTVSDFRVVHQMVAVLYELRYGRAVPLFPKQRMAAEITARNLLGGGEVTLDMIYEQLYQYSKEEAFVLRTIEEQCEIDNCVPNQPMIAVWKWCRRQGKKIVITTDMYLSRNVIQSILVKIGVDYDFLFISGEENVTKRTGKLFSNVLKKLKIDSPQIVHIGDDSNNDIAMPKVYGIVSLERIMNEKKSMEYIIPKLYSNTVAGDHLRSILVEYASNFPSMTSEQRIGYTLLGPLLVDFCQWLHQMKEKKHLNKLFFVAREGYLIQKVYATLYPEETDSLVYVRLNKNLLRLPLLSNSNACEYFVKAKLGRLTYAWNVIFDHLYIEDYEAAKKQIRDKVGFTDFDTSITLQDLESGRYNYILTVLFDWQKLKIEEQASLLEDYLLSMGFFNGAVGLVNNSINGNGQALLTSYLSMKGRKADIWGLQFMKTYKCEKLLEGKCSAWLTDSNIGYNTQDVPIGNKSFLNITLKEDTETLDEVVVVGYGSQKKVNVIGSIASVDSKALESRAVPDVSNMLTGQMSGVTITQESGNPGQDAGTIRIRGVGSFGATPSPLVLVDGLPGSLSDLTPADIDNISVLKDASSAAIYGSRAANGVILVTTKKGKEGKARIIYNGSVGMSQATELPELAHSYEYAEFYNKAIGTETYTPEMIQKYRDGSDPDNYADEMYLDDLLGGHALQTKHELSVSGGTEKVQYMVSLGYLRQNGLLDNNYYNRYNARVNLGAELAKNLKLQVRLSGMTSDRHEPSTPGSLDIGGFKGIISNAVRFPGLTPTYLQNGEVGLGPKLQGTPVAWVDCASSYREDYDKFKNNIELSYQPIDGLTLKILGGYNYTLSHVRHYRCDMILTGDKSTGPSTLSDEMKRTVYKTFQAVADYNKSFGKHNLAALVGYTWEDEGQRTLSGSRNNFPSDDVPFLGAGGADGQTNGGGGYDWAIQSVFGRLTYNYDQRYLFETTMRYDGSSRFPTDSKYGFFPSLAAGWRISEEQFWKENENLSFINNLKLKASYGILGNNNIGNYPYQSVYSLGQEQNYVFGGVYTQGAAVTTYVDPGLKWERTRTTDVGIETAFFNNKLTFNASYFYRKTTDVLYKPAASYSSIFGLSVSQVNTGELENKGWEFEIGHQNTIGKFHYHINGNFSIIDNKVLTLGMGNVTQNNGMVGNGSDLFIGYPMQMFYGYKTDGVFLTDDEVGDWYDQTAIAKGSKAGDIRYVDITGDGKVTPDDKTFLGSRIPKYTFGLNFGGEYKGFDFSVLLQGVAKVKGMLSVYAGHAFYQEGNIQKWQMENCWNVQQDNRYPEYPRLEIMSNAGSNNTLTSDFWVLDASFLKVRNVQLGYTLPEHIVKKFGSTGMRFYVSLDNPLTFKGYRKGWDPENTSNNGQYYPTMSTYTLGLTLKF